MLTSGLILAAAAIASYALNFTAVPVIVDLPLVSLIIALLAVALLGLGLRRQAKGSRARRLTVGSAVAALVASLGVAVLSASDRFLSYRAAEVRFRSAGAELSGTLYAPRAAGPNRGVVLVHGSGRETRKEYAFFAKLLARSGVAGLAYDKRGTGRSTGKLYESTYRDYADDVLAAVRYLEQHEGIRSGCIGLLGFSEGEWVAPLAASQSRDIAFLVIVGASGLSPSKQVNAEIAIRLRDRGYPEAVVARALALNERVFEYQRTGREGEGLKKELTSVREELWFLDANDIPGELYPLEEYAWWRSVMDFAPGPVWEQLRVPALLLKGGRDPNSTAEVARREIEGALSSDGKSRAEFVVFPTGDHAVLEWPLGRKVPPPVFARGYLDTLVRWIGQQECVAP